MPYYIYVNVSINIFNIAFASCFFLVNLSSVPVPYYIYVNVSIHLPFPLKSNVFDNGMAGYNSNIHHWHVPYYIEKNYSLSTTVNI